MSETASNISSHSTSRARSNFVNDSLISHTVLCLSLAVLGMVGFASWWIGSIQSDARQHGRSQEIAQLAELLTPASQDLLSAGELTATRRLVMQAARTHDLAVCRIVLSDGRVIADAEPSHINQPLLPENWHARPADDLVEMAGENYSSSETFDIAGHGGAILQIVGKPPQAPLDSTLAGTALIGACALCAIVLAHRRIRSRCAALLQIRGGLIAFAGGERDLDLLTLRSDGDADVEAWNELLTERRALENAVSGERAKMAVDQQRGTRIDLDNIVDTLPFGVIVLDATARARSANGAAAAALGVERTKLLGLELNKLLTHKEADIATLAITSGAPQRHVFEVDRREQSGGILRISIRPTRQEDSGGALLMLEDVTQQRIADAARNSFVAQATHELRAPLTNMRLCLEAAMDDEADAAELANHMNVINLETRRLERLVSEMLSVSEIEAGSLQLRRDEVRLEKLFDEIKHDYSKQAQEKKVTLLLEMPPKWPLLSGDRDKLAAAYHNLVSNALKYTPSGGRVTVAAHEESQKFIVNVSDTGIGIAEADRPRIFEKFYRAKDERVAKITGTGLGLALAREVARLHGGDLSFTSELNTGSTFTLTVPVARAA